MYVVDGIAYAGEAKQLIQVLSVRPLEGYQLRVRFTDESEKIFDFTSLLDAPCYLPLKDKAVFDSVYLEHGCPVWNDGEIDIAPERLYQDGVSVKGDVSA